MKLIFKPKTSLGRWSIILIAMFFLFLSIFFILINLGERGGDTFFSNLKLTIPILIAATSAVSSFVVGIISIIKNKEKSVIVFLSSILGFLVLLFVIGEIVFPH